ncbi:hypothetical protein AVEN_218088-1 [Araneus ventricosus]|uniref:Uncharacterized protein n=1 Tax=Araneus ventricosus TaxID=182803 RepID=A0A4Y2QSG4_ARAVE|nr:hypothetical protein AVEN_218088-1 [Araneus ventricosus]
MASIGDRKKRFINEIEDEEDDFTDAQPLLPRPAKGKKPNPRSCDLNLAECGSGPSKRDEEDNPDLIMFDDYDIPLQSKSKESPKAATRGKKPAPSSKTARENACKPATPRYDISFTHDRDIPPFMIYMGRGISMELKEFRKVMYLGFQRMNDNNEVRNCFNIPLDLLDTLKKAIEAMACC